MISARLQPVLYLLLASTAACGSTTATTQPASSPRDARLAELEALYHARQDSALARHTPADVRFMTEMIGHHAQAVAMGRMAPSRGAGPAVQTLAARIVSAQLDEISLMQQWLRNRSHPVPEVHLTAAGVMVHGPGGHEHGGHPMHGMLSEAQMRQLEEATGREFERLFLTFMIQHHTGAVVMVDELFASDGAAQDPSVFQLASEIHAEQITEIARMERMLAALPAGEAGR